MKIHQYMDSLENDEKSLSFITHQISEPRLGNSRCTPKGYVRAELRVLVLKEWLIAAWLIGTLRYCIRAVLRLENYDNLAERQQSRIVGVRCQSAYGI